MMMDHLIVRTIAAISILLALSLSALSVHLTLTSWNVTAYAIRERWLYLSAVMDIIFNNSSLLWFLKNWILLVHLNIMFKYRTPGFPRLTQPPPLP